MYYNYISLTKHEKIVSIPIFFFNFSMYIHIQHYTVSPYLPSQSLPALGGRKFFFQQNLCHWGRGPGWPVVRHSSLQNPGGKNVISETSRQNLLKFCIRLPMTILRTNPHWHFAQKTQKVGQNLSFLVKKWRFFEKKFFQRQLLVTGSPSAKTPS